MKKKKDFRNITGLILNELQNDYLEGLFTSCIIDK